MTHPDLFSEFQELINSRDPKVTALLHRLAEQSAMIKDQEINNDLLQELIVKYSESENRLNKLNRELNKKQDRLDLDLSAAAEIQRSLLPHNVNLSDALDVAWRFRPCDKIGGDIFNIIPLGDDHWAFYMIDVAGHGVTAAMIAVTVYQYLQPQSGHLMSGTTQPDADRAVRRPAEVFKFLDREYPFERFNSFFTMNYAVFNTKTGQLTASSAGHPSPIIIRKDGSLTPLKKGGRPIGTIDLRLSEEEPIVFLEDQVQLYAGDKLLSYTDGVTEYHNQKGDLYGLDRFYETLIKLKDRPLPELIEMSYQSLIEFGNNAEPMDDISLVGIELKN